MIRTNIEQIADDDIGVMFLMTVDAENIRHEQYAADDQLDDLKELLDTVLAGETVERMPN